MRARHVLCLLLCLCGCSSGQDDMMSEPLEMTITVPTTLGTYTTSQSSVIVGGTITGLTAGVNRITAYGHFQNGSVSDEIVITHN